MFLCLLLFYKEHNWLDIRKQNINVFWWKTMKLIQRVQYLKGTCVNGCMDLCIWTRLISLLFWCATIFSRGCDAAWFRIFSSVVSYKTPHASSGKQSKINVNCTKMYITDGHGIICIGLYVEIWIIIYLEISICHMSFKVRSINVTRKTVVCGVK